MDGWLSNGADIHAHHGLCTTKVAVRCQALWPKSTSGRLPRLNEYDMILKWRPEIRHQLANATSCLHRSKVQGVDVNDPLPGDFVQPASFLGILGRPLSTIGVEEIGDTAPTRLTVLAADIAFTSARRPCYTRCLVVCTHATADGCARLRQEVAF